MQFESYTVSRSDKRVGLRRFALWVLDMMFRWIHTVADAHSYYACVDLCG